MILKTGDILHCTGDRFLSRIIRKLTGSRFSHTAVVVECWGNIYIADAQNNGVNPKDFDSWMQKYKYKFTVSRPQFEFDAKELSKKAFSVSGVTKYDKWSLLFYQPLYLLTGKWRGKKNEAADDKLYCSEFVAWLYEFPNWWAMSPEDVYKHCDSDEWYYFMNEK